MGVLLLPIISYAIYLRKQNQQVSNTNKRNESELKEIKVRNKVLDEVVSITSANYITNAVARIFNNTKADRFLILFAVNGKNHFNVVSVFFEQHKNGDSVNAVARYRNVKIDDRYRAMLKEAELNETVILETNTMKPSLLKDFYELEEVKHAYIKHLSRSKIDDNNDVVLFSSIATHEEKKFTRKELAFANTQYNGTIVPNIEQLLK
tara:strand:+ start:3366 stop:3986 length:621 start_codon:yes stop_codon:yes gene_type:complete